jgi:hypothetical protein
LSQQSRGFPGGTALQNQEGILNRSLVILSFLLGLTLFAPDAQGNAGGIG